MDGPKPVNITDPYGNTYTLYRNYTRGIDDYTQGFYYIKSTGMILQSTGEYGKSKIQYLRLNPQKGTADTVEAHPINKIYFGEGAELINGKIYQLTWQKRTIIVYDPNGLKKLKEVTMPRKIREGWGLTHSVTPSSSSNDPKPKTVVYVTDGSSYLHHCSIDPKTDEFTVVKSVRVTFYNTNSKRTVYVQNLNELEFINGEVWANVYTTNYVVQINPETGVVSRRWDLSALEDMANRRMLEVYKRGLERGDEVLNGIAYNEVTRRYYLTGKDWPLVFELDFLGKKDSSPDDVSASGNDDNDAGDDNKN